MSRNVSAVILCEDKLQQTFIRKFLNQKGFENRKIILIDLPNGKGCGFKFVQDQFELELKQLNRRHSKTVLIAMIDQDGKQERFTELVRKRDKYKSDYPNLNIHRILIFAPNRSIETWIKSIQDRASVPEINVLQHYLRGCEKDCLSAVKELAVWCNAQSLPDYLPISLYKACEEYQNIKK
jgi:hypothetical protein